MSWLHSARVSALMVLLLGCVLVVYWPGLQGGFLFDDYPNLSKLGSYGGINSWEAFNRFVFNGFSGPTGRPISLASFLLNDNDWPSAARPFKQTNLLIHLLCGVLLFWASLRVLIFYGKSANFAVSAGLLSAALWMLHPMMVSTTLYVVQRMAQLSTLFVLAGIVGYLLARQRLTTAPLSGYFWMTVSLGTGTVLATFSKENGALLPMLVLVIELCRPSSVQDSSPQFFRLWKTFFLWLPSLLILAYLASRVTFAENPWPNRPFNQVERLLSEARILWEYLFHLFVPQIEGRGLYQDAYNISTGLLSPWTTAPAVAGILALPVVAWMAKRRYSLLSLAVLFFLVSHIIESSVIGLELYFEHRNYMAALFVFLPISVGLLSLRDRLQAHVIALIVMLLVGLVSWMTWQRAMLWSDTEKLELYWAYASPDSPRAANAVAAYLVNSGRYAAADAYLEDALARRPDSALLSSRILLQKVYSRVASPEDFSTAANRLLAQPFDAQAVKALRMLAEQSRVQDVALGYQVQTLKLLDQVAKNGAYQNMPLFVRLHAYLRAGLLLSLGDSEAAYEQYVEALALYADTDAGMKMVSELASSGQPELALKLLDRTVEVLAHQPDDSLLRSRVVYQTEIDHMRQVLKRDVADLH
ncbi:tetratricopeptide repeat protein [Pseudomonas aestusnigri]|uniref:tetratricopeptide repeat protein n=1 Tax=Halopseudomonas aestusnigri TaxID=857252 RepID=UPI001D1937CD|nr:tetratricopeptide repeat protein [Halopseudomonas aestusnigri]MCC4260146.1 tetratricopeptide repeat protein [Halopseudomonas aestusnigri]